MKTALVDGSRYGWRGALIFPEEYFDPAPAPPSGGTVGLDVAGVDTSPASGDRAWLSSFTMPGAGDGVTGYLRFDATSTAGTNAKFLVYADNGGGQPGALLYASTGQAVPGGGGILTYSVSVPGLTAGQVVWLGGVTDSFQAKFQTTTPGAQSRMEGTTYSTPNSTWTQSGTGAATMNAWMDYTSSGGGSYTIGADAGAFVLAGTQAGLRYTRVMPANTGAFALAGTNANLLFNRSLAANSGTFSITGPDVGFVYNRRVTADTAAYSLVGTDATLVYTPAGGYSLSADAGTFNLSGSNAGLVYTRRMVADTGPYVLAGSDATISYTPLPTNYQLDAESGPFNFYGTMVTLIYSGAPIADHGVSSALTYPITHSITDWAH